MKIQKLTAEHTDAVHRVLSGCFQNPWSADTVKALMNSENACCFGAFEDDTLVGYIALEWVLDEGSLTDLAVLPQYRRRGLAEALTEELIKEAQRRNLQFVTLEVRVSNTPAVNLYKKLQFQEVGKRPNYYSSPKEDALLMTRYL